MKKIIIIMIAPIVISFSSSAQSVGDYRSISNGNWNDATKWETYDGSSWVSTTAYPGQNPGTGKVTITSGTEIKITQSLPRPIASLLVDLSLAYPDGYTPEYTYGILTFSAESAVSLNVSGDVVIPGKVRIDNLNGAKTHWLSLGGNFEIGQAVWGDGYWEPYIESLQTINQDDKLGISFNTTIPNSQIGGPFGISFQDITFNGIGIVVSTPISILGTATFINGIITPDGYYCPGGACDDYIPYNWLPNFAGGTIFLDYDATVTGASNASFVDGSVWKKGHGSFTFPIGDEGIYSPLAVTAPVGQQISVAAHYHRSSGAALRPISDPGLYNVSNCEYWDLSTIGEPIDVTIGWNSASGCGSTPYITNVSDVKLALNRFISGNSWDSSGGIATGTTTNGSVTWSVAVPGTVTLGNVGTSCVTPNSLSSSNIGTSTATVSWSAVTGAESYDVDYSVATSGGLWINAATATTSTSVGLSGLTYLVNYFWRVRANCSLESSSYRQAQFTTITDCGTPSGLSTTNITHNSATLSWDAVINAINYNVEYKSHTMNSWVSAVTGTTSLTYNLSSLMALTGYDWRVRANCSSSTSVYIGAQFQTLPCGFPSGLSTTNITSNSATLSWAVVPNATNYRVDYKQSTAGSWITVATGLNSFSYNLGGLSASTAYYWRVYNQCGGFVGNAAEAYFVTLSVCNDVYETNNTSSLAKTISIGNTIAAGITSTTDIDWFKVTTPNNSNTNLEVTLSNLRADYELYVYNKSLKLVGSSVTTGTSNEVVIYNSKARNATYYIKVTGKNGANNTSQCYNLLANAISGGGTASRASEPVNQIPGDENNHLLYPNPASDFVYVGFNSTINGPVNVQLFNTSGQLTKQVAVNISKGYNQVKVAINDIKEGMYLLRISKGDLSIVRKFVIAR